MNDAEYTFRIDAFSPDTLPMARLGEYLTALAELIGSKERTHFVRLDPGSTRIVHKVEAVEVPKVARRLAENGLPHERAFRRLDDMLAQDNAVGELTSTTGVVVPFPGRERPKPVAYAPFRQDGFLDGQVVRVGGKDATAHITLQDGEGTYTNIELDRELARELAHYLYGARVRVFGSGRWERGPDGAWKLLSFTVARFEVLEEASLSDVLADIRAIASGTGLHDRNVYRDLLAMRTEDGAH